MMSNDAETKAFWRPPEGLREHSWDVWYWWMQIASTLIVAIAAVIAMVDPQVSGWRILAIPVVAAVFIGWSWLPIVRWNLLLGSRWNESTYCIVEMILLITLIGLHPDFGLAIFFVYWRMFSLIRSPVWIAHAVLLSLSISWAYAGFSFAFPLNTPVHWGLLALSLLGSGVMAGFIGSIITESAKRRDLLDQLESTREALAKREREAGIAAERQRMAGEVHDTLAQDFASIVMHLEAAGANLRSDDAVVAHLEAAKQSARTGIAESRRIVQALRPELLSGRTLVDALEALCVKWENETAIPCTFRRTGDELSTPRDADVLLYRGLQESLTNVRKHASARHVAVTLSYLGDEAILDVRDDGIGFEQKTISPRLDGDRVGLDSMRERASAFGAHVTVESAPCEGTTISIQLPVTDDQGEERNDRA